MEPTYNEIREEIIKNLAENTHNSDYFPRFSYEQKQQLIIALNALDKLVWHIKNDRKIKETNK